MDTQSRKAAILDSVSVMPLLTFGGLVRSRRERRNISAEDFAEDIGCTASELDAIETKSAAPSERQLTQIAAALRLDRAALAEMATSCQ